MFICETIQNWIEKEKMTCKLTNFVFIKFAFLKSLLKSSSRFSSRLSKRFFSKFSKCFFSSAFIWSRSQLLFFQLFSSIINNDFFFFFIVRTDVFSTTFAISNLKFRKKVDENERKHHRIKTRYEEHSS